MKATLPGLARGLEQVAADVPKSKLTPREREVVVLICDGLTAKEIAEELGISVKTVDQHKMGAMEKLDIHRAPSLVRWAIRQGLVEA